MNCWKKCILLLIFIILIGLTLLPETLPESLSEIPIIDSPPAIDGKLDDPAWGNALTLSGFKTAKPDYGKEPSGKTIAYIVMDEENLYFAFRCFDPDPAKIKSSVTKRDNIFGEDWVSIVLDTFNDNQSGYGFFINPQGIQGDGVLDLQSNLDHSHDMVWYSKGILDHKGYTVEAKIPFKSFRFPSKKKFTMGVGFFRQIIHSSQLATFPEIDPKINSILAQSLPVTLKGIKYKRVIELLPAFTHTRRSAIQEGQLAAEPHKSDLSLTAKVGLTPELTLDATYNPDFNQVEADAGQVDFNLRHGIFYGEKRPFFLEGNEIFRFAGNTQDAPLMAVVHTRQIVDPVFGLKLTGKLGRRNTIAAIYAIDEVPGQSGDVDNADFSVFRFKHSLNDDSYLGSFYTGRNYQDGYNRVYGADGRIRLTPTSFTDFHIMGSATQGQEPNLDTARGHALGLRYSLNTRSTAVEIGYQDISENFQTQTGFLTRNGISRLAVFGQYRIYPKSKFLLKIEPYYWSFHIYDKTSEMFETFNLFTLRFYFPGQTELRLDAIAANEVFAGQRFRKSAFGIRFQSQLHKALYLSFNIRKGGAIFYDPQSPYQGRGSRANLDLILQPSHKLSTSLGIAYENFYRDSDSQKIYDYTILRSRTTWQLNKYLFFRGIGEYNFFHEKLNLDFLASFTYIPGTVFHLGYGSIFERIQWQDREYVAADRFFETRRGFFFKVSYLWRL